MTGFEQRLHSFARKPDDSEDLAFQKWLILVVALSGCFCGMAWGALYYAVFGIGFIMALPLLFVLIVGSAIVISDFISDHRPLVYAQLTSIMLVPAFIQWSIGSMDQSGLVIAWSFLGPFGALIFLSNRQAMNWMAMFLGVVVISAVFEPKFLGYSFTVSDQTRALFYIMNLGASSTVIFGGLWFFVNQKELALRLLKKNSELELTNLEQELMLRKSEKLATLGRLSAGVAHELNNPASAVQRGAEQIKKILPEFERAQFQFGQSHFSNEQEKAVSNLKETFLDENRSKDTLGSLERSDREYEMETELETTGIKNAWDFAPVLVSMGFELNDLSRLKTQFNTDQLSVLISAICHKYSTKNLLDEIGQGTSRISEIIKALKSYTYMDQAPRQFIDIHEGIENTLVMLRSKLRKEVVVHREFEEGLPPICGYGSELNQVWTNLIDNAVDAMNGKGEIRIKTFEEEGWVLIEISDNGPGMPEEVKSKIFDPFYTTKPQGQGTGLGLHISYNIIVQKHHGEISVYTKPGETRFQIKLPINWEGTEETE